MKEVGKSQEKNKRAMIKAYILLTFSIAALVIFGFKPVKDFLTVDQLDNFLEGAFEVHDIRYLTSADVLKITDSSVELADDQHIESRYSLIIPPLAGVKAILDRELLTGQTYHLAGLPVAEDTFGHEMFIQMAVVAPLAFMVIMILVFLLYRKIAFLLPIGMDAMFAVILGHGLTHRHREHGSHHEFHDSRFPDTYVFDFL